MTRSSPAPSSASPDAATTKRRKRLAERSWGRWGENDERGAANLIGGADVAAAASLVRSGRVFGLGRPVSPRTPVPTARPRVSHFMLRDGGDYEGESAHRARFSDDSMLLPLHAGTHVDALAHVWYGDKLYNGFAARTVTSRGAGRCGIHRLGPLVGRGIVLDAAQLTGAAALPTAHRISAEELEACRDRAGIEIRRGDIVLIRTGWKAEVSDTGLQDFERAPGPTLDAACWLAEHDIAAVGSDTYVFEALPNDGPSAFPVHELLLRDCGIPIIEDLNLDELVSASVSEFLFIAAPLLLEGATASPLNPLAVS